MSTTETDLTQHRQGPPPVTKDDVQEMFSQFLRNRSFSAEQGGQHLFEENAQLRADKRALNTQVTDLEAKVPPAGAVVLKGDDIKLFADLKALVPEGKKPEDLAALLTERDTLDAKVKDLERSGLVRDIAESEGWKASNLLRLTQGMDLVMEDVEEEIDDPDNEGQKKKVPIRRGFIVQTRDAAGNVTAKKRLGDELKDFLPSLKVEATQDENDDRADKGTRFVRQPAGRKVDPKGATKNVSQNFISKAYATEDKK